MNINEQTPQMCVWCSTKIPSRLHGTAKSWKSTDAYQITNAAGTDVTYTCDGNQIGTIKVIA